jgi:hypothetical protein
LPLGHPHKGGGKDHRLPLLLSKDTTHASMTLFTAVSVVPTMLLICTVIAPYGRSAASATEWGTGDLIVPRPTPSAASIAAESTLDTPR